MNTKPRGVKERKSAKQAAACRKNAQRPRPGHITDREGEALAVLKRRARAEGFPAIASACVTLVTRFAAQLSARKPVRQRRVARVLFSEFEFAAKFLSDRCGWPAQSQNELGAMLDGTFVPIAIVRTEIPRPGADASSPATNGHAVEVGH